MEDKKKKRSPKPCLTQPAQAPGTLRRVPVPTSHSGSLALGLPHLPSPKQRAKFKRAGKEKCRPVLAGGGGGSAGTPLQHSFLTEVTDVYEMEGGLLNLLNDFHSGRLQAFGKSGSRAVLWVLLGVLVWGQAGVRVPGCLLNSRVVQGRNVPSSSWSMFGRCRRSWPDCTSAWMCVGRKRTRKKRMGSQKACLRSRRRQWLTATWTSCLAIWKILAIPYRSYTWQRMPSLRTSQLRRCHLNSSAALLFKL